MHPAQPDQRPFASTDDLHDPTPRSGASPSAEMCQVRPSQRRGGMTPSDPPAASEHPHSHFSMPQQGAGPAWSDLAFVGPAVLARWGSGGSWNVCRSPAFYCSWAAAGSALRDVAGRAAKCAAGQLAAIHCGRRGAVRRGPGRTTARINLTCMRRSRGRPITIDYTRQRQAPARAWAGGFGARGGSGADTQKTRGALTDGFRCWARRSEPGAHGGAKIFFFKRAGSISAKGAGGAQ